MADLKPPLSPISPIKGVQFAPPPAELIPSIRSSMDRALATLPAGSRGALVGVVTDTGMNTAIVTKLNQHWTVQAWIGKKWQGPVEGGAQVLVTW